MANNATLVVPIRVYAIHQAQERAAIGPEMDFESLPYYDSQRGQDVNPAVPYLAESVIPLPFEDANFILKAGVHLNWDFPQFLKRTKFRASDATEFPAVPTRWLISRYGKGQRNPDRKWVVESDTLLWGDGRATIHDLAQTSVDVNINDGAQPYAYLGRSSALEAWLQRGGQSGDDSLRWKGKHNGQPLTAMGWGSPSFDVYYPNCRGVFGFHDPTGTPAHRYKLIGWYGDLSDDYWLNYLRSRSGDWGLSDIDALTHLDAEHKVTLKREHMAKLFRDDLGVTLAVNGEFSNSEAMTKPSNWDRMVCRGQAQWVDEALLDANTARYAVGNTPTEALSAMIAKSVASDESGPEREKLEDCLAAILMGDRLKSLKLDIGPKFREFRHAEGFGGSDGGTQWVIESVDDNPTKTPIGDHHEKHRTTPRLPRHVVPVLNALNEAQRRFDATARELETQRFQLYVDWYRYMHASYPPPGETEEYLEVTDLLTAIDNGSLADVKRLQWRLGEPASGDKHATGIAADIADARLALDATLTRLNNDAASDPHIVDQSHWEVQQRPAPRFWEPAPPVLVVALPRTGKGRRKTEGQPEADTALQPPLDCHAISKNLTFAAGPHFSVNELLAAGDIPWSPPEDPLSTDLPIFRGEWQVEVFPVATMHPATKSSGAYDPKFVQTNYLLAENEPDLDDNPTLTSPLALAKVGAIYTGSTYINQKLDDRYRSQLLHFRDLQEARCKALTNVTGKPSDVADQTNGEALPAPNQAEYELKQLMKTLKIAASAEGFLDDHDLLVVTLNGFNAALLQRHESIQLNPADPLGFAEYKAFAQDVAETLHGSFKGISPDPHALFMPIRSGALRVMTLRLVDLFGRFIDLTPSDLATALSMRVPGHGDWVRLPPRLAQSARWNFRFLQASPPVTPSALPTAEPTETQSHQATSPVHGWVVPNLLDKSLDFFDPNGRRLGAVRTSGFQSEWDGEELVTLPSRLRQIVNWLLAADQEPPKASAHLDGVDDLHFLDEFIEDVEEALDNIHPDDREGQSAFSVLMGRPMAVVQFGVALELKGRPAVNNSWSALIGSMPTAQPAEESSGNWQPARSSTDGFDEVQFPYRLGEYRQRNDGLVGYWNIKNDGALSDAFNVNDSVTAFIERDNVQAFKVEYEARAQIDTGHTERQWIDLKNEEWQLSDKQGRSLFEFLLDEQDGTVKKQDIIQSFVREGSRVWAALVERKCLTEEMPFDRIHHYSEASQLSVSAADKMQQFVALVDPHGLIHLSSGVQPVKDIKLPARFVDDALNRIELRFLTAPVLTPEHELHVSLPKEQEYSWSWIETNSWPSLSTKDNQVGHAVTSTQPTVIAESDIKPFQTIGFFAHRFVLREGHLVLTHKAGQSTDAPKEE